MIAVAGNAPRVAEYERRFAEQADAGHAVAFGYARTALASVCGAAELGAGDEVVLSPLTCKVVPLALISAGLQPVYADIEGTTLNLSADCLRRAIGTRTRAIVVQRTYGHGAGVHEVATVAEEAGLVLIEDCAHCLPAAFRTRARPRITHAAIFSNNPGKPLPAGSGGVLVTDDGALAAAVARHRDGLPPASLAHRLVMRTEGWVRNRLLGPSLYWPAFDMNRRVSASYRARGIDEELADEIEAVAVRIDDAQARSGLAWLDRAADVEAHRRDCCERYQRGLRDLRGIGSVCGTDGEPLYYFPALVDRKQELLRQARRARVEIVPWPLSTPIYPVSDERALPGYGYRPGSCPVAEHVAGQLVGLPTHPLVSEEHVAAVIALLREHAGGARS